MFSWFASATCASHFILFFCYCFFNELYASCVGNLGFALRAPTASPRSTPTCSAPVWRNPHELPLAKPHLPRLTSSLIGRRSAPATEQNAAAAAASDSARPRGPSPPGMPQMSSPSLLSFPPYPLSPAPQNSGRPAGQFRRQPWPGALRAPLFRAPGKRSVHFFFLFVQNQATVSKDPRIKNHWLHLFTDRFALSFSFRHYV